MAVNNRGLSEPDSSSEEEASDVVWAHAAKLYFQSVPDVADNETYDFDTDSIKPYDGSGSTLDTTRGCLEKGICDGTDVVPNPLALVLPQEYRSVDVTKFFPQFCRDRPLRFSKLFGSGTSNPAQQKPKETNGTSSRNFSDGSNVSLSIQRTSVTQPLSPPAEECKIDDEILLLRPECSKISARLRKQIDNLDSVAPWRSGPSAFWYNQLDWSQSTDHYPLGSKSTPEVPLARSSDGNDKTRASTVARPNDTSKTENDHNEVPLMFDQVQWEDDIIYNGEDIREDLAKQFAYAKQPHCGWIPTQQTRTYESFISMLRNGTFAQMIAGPSSAATSSVQSALGAQNLYQLASVAAASVVEDGQPPDANFAVFPPDNFHLISGSWEDEIIYDSADLTALPRPKVLKVNWMDDPNVLGLPADRKIQEAVKRTGPNKTSSCNSPIKGEPKKKSQLVLGKVVNRLKDEGDDAGTSQTFEKDPFNLSNDEFYFPKITASTLGAFNKSLLQGIVPALFPTHLNSFRLRHFYRMPLKKYNRGPSARGGFFGVTSLDRFAAKKQKQREEERKVSGGGEMFFMRALEDVSVRDGEVVFCEFSEEYPSLMQQPGMASKIRNYYKRKQGKDNCEPAFEFGETVFAHTFPFLAALHPGEALQALENNLYRAPLYKHQLQSKDFLIVRTSHGLYVRSVSGIFCAGQQSPLHDVPMPGSKQAATFERDFLLVFIYRLFQRSRSNPKRLRIEDVRKAFSHLPESSIRKRLKQCAEFKRLGAGSESSYWILRNDFRLPSDDELRALVTPELCCTFYSMATAEQRLKDAGYGDKYFAAAKENEDEDDEDKNQAKLDDEVQCAPWNTTRAYLAASKGKCLLDINGIADPTGCGEGFSFVRMSTKPLKQEETQPLPKRSVTGTDADLRKLSLNNAKQLLKEFGVKDEEINTLSRWEIIDVIRTLSTQQARSGGVGITKFARGSMKYNSTEMQLRYKAECQRIFDLQNKVLRNEDELSTDDESMPDEDSDIEEMGKNIETMLTANVSSKSRKPSQPYAEDDDEEKEREELRRLLLRDAKPTTSSRQDVFASAPESSKLSDNKAAGSSAASSSRVLIIYRSFRGSDGKTFVREEEVRLPELIDAYIAVRKSKERADIREFAIEDDEYKEEKRREKRRLQDQLRRLKRSEQKAKVGRPASKKPPAERATPPPITKANLLKMKCSACGESGHMRTNKNCPLYTQTQLPLSQTIAPTDEALAEKFELSSTQKLVSVEGTKLRLPKALLDKAEKMRREALILKFPKKALKHSLKKRSAFTATNLTKRSKTVSGLAASANSKTGSSSTGSFEDSIAAAIEGALAEATEEDLPSASYATTSKNVGAEEFLSPFAGTSRVTLRPQLKQRLLGKTQKSKQGQTRAEEIKKLQKSTVQLDYLQKPKPAHSETAVERRRGNPHVNMSILLESILNELKELPEAAPFLLPVNKKEAKDYLQVVKNPMDLQKIRMTIAKNDYKKREEFLQDVKLILDNSAKYNGPEHKITKGARRLFEHAVLRITENEAKLMQHEKAINPLLDDNDLVAFSYILGQAVERMKAVPKGFAFHVPVDRRKLKDYFVKIKTPMDLSTMERKVKQRAYLTVEDFRADMETIYKNSELFNGLTSSYTLKALEIVNVGRDALRENASTLRDLQENIAVAKGKFRAEYLSAEAIDEGGDNQPSHDDSFALSLASTDLELRTSSALSSRASDAFFPLDEDANASSPAAKAEQEEGEVDDDEIYNEFMQRREDSLDGARPSVVADDLQMSDGEDYEMEPATVRGSSSVEQTSAVPRNEHTRGDSGDERRQSSASSSTDADDDDEDYQLGGSEDPVSRSKIGLAGQLHTDLAMSDSDADDENDEEERLGEGEFESRHRRKRRKLLATAGTTTQDADDLTFHF